MSRKSTGDSGTTFQFLVALPTTYTNQLDAIAAETGAPRMALVRSAIETFLAERGGEKLSVDLPDELRVDLAALHAAMYGASVQLMVADALRQFVDQTLKDNDGIRERFAAAHQQIEANGTVAGGRVIEFRRTRMS